MKIIRVIITILLSATAITGIAVTSLGVLTYTNGITLTNVQSDNFSPSILKFSLAVSKPVSADKVAAGDLLVLGASSPTPQLGEAIDLEANKNHYVIRAYSNTEKTDVISYGTAKTVNKVLFTVPILGILTSILSNPVGVIAFTLLIGILIGVYFKMFYQKKPKKVREQIKEENQIIILKEIFDEAPPFKNRAERKQIIKEQQIEQKAQKKVKTNA